MAFVADASSRHRTIGRAVERGADPDHLVKGRDLDAIRQEPRFGQLRKPPKVNVTARRELRLSDPVTDHEQNQAAGSGD